MHLIFAPQIMNGTIERPKQPPLPLQAPLPDLPAVGFLRNEEIAATLERWPDLARADLPSEDRRAFQQLELWLRNATGTYPRDQVAFTY